jgi:hypothetical protein
MTTLKLGQERILLPFLFHYYTNPNSNSPPLPPLDEAKRRATM